MNKLLITVMLSSIVFIISCSPTNKKASITTVKTVTHESATTHSSSSIQPLANEAVANEERLISIVTPATLIDAAPDQKGTPSSETKTVTHESATTHSSRSIPSLTEDQAMEIKFLRTMMDNYASQLSNIDKDLDNINEQMLTRPQDIKVLTLRQYAQLNQKGNYEKDITWLQKRLDNIYMETGVIQK